MKSVKILSFFILLSGAVLASGCGIFDSVSGMVGLNKTATVIVRATYIRSSYSVVASDLLEVKRGQVLDIIEEAEFGEGANKVLWYRVRAHDEDETEGWIEAQNVITSELLEKSRKLAEEFKNAQPQASGQLRAASNLRLSPEMSPDNVIYRLENGANFEIIDWNFVPKAEDVSEIDDVRKNEQKQGKKRTRNEEIEAAREANEPEKLEEKYDIWYQVKLDPSVSPAPAGWLFGRQVELQVPSDIVFYQQNNKKFVTWARLDNAGADGEKFSGDKDKESKTSKPGAWVILSRTNVVKAIDGIEPDFDGIVLLGYDKYDQQHYRIYPTFGEVWGVLPLRVEGTGDSRTFILKLRNSTNGQLEDKRFVITTSKNRMVVTPPADMANYEKK